MENLVINAESPVTKVDQIVNSLIGQIEQGALANSERLLSINMFSKKHAVARDTVEKAYKRLKARGYIQSVAGKGYYISGTNYNS